MDSGSFALWLFGGILALLVLVQLEAASIRNKRRKKAEAAFDFHPESYVNKNNPTSARFADEQTLKKGGLFKGKGWRIGYSPKGHVLRYSGPGHMILIAPPRTGKCVSILVPLLLEKRRGSCIVIDPKGELAAICAHRAKQFSDVVILNPFERDPLFASIIGKSLRGLKSTTFNPLASLDPKSVSFGGDVELVTDGIVAHEGGGDSNAAHFTDSARQLISAIIRVLVKYGRPEQKNLVEVRTVLQDVFSFARKYENCGDIFAQQELSRYTGPHAEESRELAGVISTAKTQTGFIGMEGIAECMKGDGLRFADLKRRRMTVFVILPLHKLGPCGKWFRLVMAAALADLLRVGRGLPVLCAMDEFRSIGKLQSVAVGMSQAAGAASLQFLPVLQDLHQLKAMYPNEEWKTFLSTAAVKTFFASSPGDLETAQQISELCGMQEIIRGQRTVQGSFDDDRMGWSDSMGAQWEPLLQSWAVPQLADDEMLIFCHGVRDVVRGKRKPYFKTSEFRGQYRPNPYFNRPGILERVFKR